MTTTELRRRIKRAVDQLPVERLASVADFVAFLRQPTLKERLGMAEKDFAAGKGVNWRRVRDEVGSPVRRTKENSPAFQRGVSVPPQVPKSL